MINHELRPFGPSGGRYPGLRLLTRRHRLLHGVKMNGFRAICGICRKIIR